MAEKKLYEATEEDMKSIRVACIGIWGCGIEEPDIRLNRVWQSMGDRMGFNWQTVELAPEINDRSFYAIPKEGLE